MGFKMALTISLLFAFVGLICASPNSGGAGQTIPVRADEFDALKVQSELQKLRNSLAKNMDVSQSVCIKSSLNAHNLLVAYSKELGSKFTNEFKKYNEAVSQHTDREQLAEFMAHPIDRNVQQMVAKNVDPETMKRLQNQLHVLENEGFGFENGKDNGEPAIKLMQRIAHEFEEKTVVEHDSDSEGSYYESQLDKAIAQLEAQLAELKEFKKFRDNIAMYFTSLKEKYPKAKKMYELKLSPKTAKEEYQRLRSEEAEKKEECTGLNDYYALANAGAVMAATFNVFMDVNKPESAYEDNPVKTHTALKKFEEILHKFMDKHGQLPTIEKVREVEYVRQPTAKSSKRSFFHSHKGKAASASAGVDGEQNSAQYNIKKQVAIIQQMVKEANLEVSLANEPVNTDTGVEGYYKKLQLPCEDGPVNMHGGADREQSASGSESD